MILDRMNRINRIGRARFGAILSILLILSKNREVENG